jgi:DNA-binding NarL/FixJ family response regulator
MGNQHNDGGRPWSVVIADDDEDLRDLMEVILRIDARFDPVGSVSNGNAAVTMVREARPDAVVLDLQMPGLDGLGAVRAIRAENPDICIIVLSAFPDPYTLADVISLGADLYLDKAKAFAELLPSLAAACELRRLALH